MAKRLTQTDKWKKDWYRELGSKWRDIWNFLLDDCNHAGIWEVSLTNLAYFTGHKITVQEIVEKFGGRVLYLADNKLFIRAFFDFQYGDAKEGFKAKQSALKELTKYGLIDENGVIKDTVPNCSEQLPNSSELSMDCLSTSISTSISKEGGVGETKPEFTATDLFKLWNLTRGPLPVAEKFTDERKRKAKAQIAKYPDKSHWEGALNEFKASPFCANEWKPGFDDLLSESKRIKALEGYYRPKKSGTVSRIGPAPISYKTNQADLAILNAPDARPDDPLERKRKADELRARLQGIKTIPDSDGAA